jgi:hypothetical protein
LSMSFSFLLFLVWGSEFGESKVTTG